MTIETLGDDNNGIPVVFYYRYLLSTSRNKRKRTKILSETIHAMLYTRNVDCLNLTFILIRHGNGVLIVVRATESVAHGEGGQFVISKTQQEGCVRHHEKSRNCIGKLKSTCKPS